MPAPQPSVFADPIATLPVKAAPGAKLGSYFNGPKPGVDVAAPSKAPTKAPPPKTVQVRAHTRTVPQKPAPTPAPQGKGQRLAETEPAAPTADASGLITPGNIDLSKRPIVRNPDGSISTVRSISVTDPHGRAYLIPTVVGKRVVSNDQAVSHWQRTGQHLGVFVNEQAANRYAQQLHEAQAREYLPRAAAAGPSAAVVDTQKLEPASQAKRGTSQRYYTPPPGRVGTKPDGYETVRSRPPGRGGIGAPVTSRPYWITSRGTGGDTALAGWSPAQRQIVAKQHAANTTALGNLLETTVHPVTDLGQAVAGQRHITAAGAASDLANIASNLIPAGKVGAAGLFGLRGLKALKAAKEGVVAADAAEAVAPIAKDAAALRGAVSGKPARAGLKDMTNPEKAVAKLDNPNLGKSVRQLQQEQKVMYSQERAKRAAAANVHLSNQELAPEERIRLAKNELKGELPKIHFQGFTELSDQAVTAMQKHILDHPHLMPFQKITASSALTNALSGKLPTPSELTLLEHVFGRDTTAGLGGIAKHPFKDTVLSVLNVPRSLMASFDLSAPFRQGLVVATRHPKIFAQNFKPMVKAFGSEKVYRASLDEIRARPTYPMMMEAKLSLTHLGRDVGAREEQFASNIAEKIPVAGHGVRASGRAYTGFLDKTRADVFDHLIGQAHQQGLNVQDPKFLKSLGTYINSATGRGDLGHFQEAGKVLNSFLFSPRLLASRLNFLNPLYYKRLDPFARKEALRSGVQLAGTLSTLLALASQVPGVKVVTDPRNPDWGKIRLGNTRIDIAGGFQQHLRLLAQLATGTAISSTTGKKLNLTAGGFGQPNRLDLFLRFFEGKESPIASFVTDYMRNSNQIGTKFSLKSEVASRMIPLLAQDSYDLYKSKHGGMNGLAAAFGGYAVGSVGLGMQTYGPGPTKGRTRRPSDYFGASSSGGSPYFASSSSPSGGGYFAK
jgi:hypothetical protein